MSCGSVTIVDLERSEAAASVDTRKDIGLNRNYIILLPKWLCLLKV